MTVSLRTQGLKRPLGISTATVRRHAELMLQALERGEDDLSILLCSDEVIGELNGRWRGKDGPTDVLSFSLLEGDDPRPPPIEGQPTMLGDLVISLPTAARQGEEHGTGLRGEVTCLLAHGLLHLVGYDHQTDEEHEEMERAARELIEAVEGARP